MRAASIFTSASRLMAMVLLAASICTLRNWSAIASNLAAACSWICRSACSYSGSMPSPPCASDNILAASAFSFSTLARCSASASAADSRCICKASA